MCDSNDFVHVSDSDRATVKSRRGFFRVLAGFLFSLVTFPAALAKAKKVALPLDKIDALQKVGGSAAFKIQGHQVLIVRDAETSVRAINPMCTHKKCQVRFKSETGLLHCKCHKSAFDMDGKVLDGPAPKPLMTYVASLEDDRVVITLPDDADSKK